MDYIAMEATARRLIKANGLPVTFSHQAATHDPTTGETTTITTPVTGYAVAMPVGPTDVIRVPELQGKKAVRLTCSVAGAIGPGDTVEWGGWLHRVINVTNLSPAGISLYSDVYIEVA